MSLTSSVASRPSPGARPPPPTLSLLHARSTASQQAPPATPRTAHALSVLESHGISSTRTGRQKLHPCKLRYTPGPALGAYRPCAVPRAASVTTAEAAAIERARGVLVDYGLSGDEIDRLRHMVQKATMQGIAVKFFSPQSGGGKTRRTNRTRRHGDGLSPALRRWDRIRTAIAAREPAVRWGRSNAEEGWRRGHEPNSEPILTQVRALLP